MLPVICCLLRDKHGNYRQIIQIRGWLDVGALPDIIAAFIDLGYLAD